MYLNFIKLNNSKTKILSTIPVNRMGLSFDIDEVLVKPSFPVRNLGVLFDSSLSFVSHIALVVIKLFLSNACLCFSLNLADAETIVHALITSHLDYCNALLIGLQKTHTHIKRLYRMYKMQLRECSPRLDSMIFTGYLLHHVFIKVLLLTLQALNGLAPLYLSDLLHPYLPIWSLRSSELGVLSDPRFRPSGCLYNISSLSAFKSQLKMYLFEMCFQWTVNVFVFISVLFVICKCSSTTIVDRSWACEKEFYK